MVARAAIFLDKDGTLIPDIPYNVDPSLITLSSGVIDGLIELQKYFTLVVVSNQSGVAKGLFEISALNKVEAKMTSLFDEQGIAIEGFYFCPHDPKGSISPYSIACDCRKPKPGMLLQAAESHNLDLSRSWMIGDILNDVQAGKSAGCKSILIDNGNETEWDLESNPERVPDFIAVDFKEAVAFITQNETYYDYQRKQHIQKI